MTHDPDEHEPSGWDPRVRERLDHLIRTRGREANSYDPARPPYAVFDCDNTSVFGDVQDAALTYMLARARFGVPMDRLRQILARGFDALAPSGLPRNVDGGTVALEDLLEDAIDGLVACASAPDSDHARAGAVKFRALYHALGEHVSDAWACAWVTRVFTGMTPAEVTSLARAAYAEALARPIASVRARSPESCPGRTGCVEVSWSQGLRAIDPMQQLFAELERAGFEVWVCSASLDLLVRAALCQGGLGYGVGATRVLGMQLARDASSKLTSTPPDGALETHGPGKVAAIERHVASRMGYGPSLVAGDSDGDAPMLEAFTDTELRLVIDRGAGGAIGRIAERADEPDSGVAVQRRDERTGRFRCAKATAGA